MIKGLPEMSYLIFGFKMLGGFSNHIRQIGYQSKAHSEEKLTGSFC